MADIELVIKISEKVYNALTHIEFDANLVTDEMRKSIANGTPLPKGHGRLIDADKCINQAWNDFYKHEEEWEKKDSDYVGVNRFHDQNGFECCLKTIGESPTVIESEDNE